MWRSAPLVLIVALFLAVFEAWAQTAPLSQGEQVWIPLKVASAQSEKTIRLEATLYRPKGDGPFALMIFSHGSTGEGRVPMKQTLRADRMASVMVKREIAVLAPMRRGRGASEGNYEESYGCDPARLRSGVETAVADTGAAIDYAKGLPFVDAKRIILAGISRGGALSVAYAARHPETVVAVVNIVGGWTSERCADDFNGGLFREAGKTARQPMLWLYAEKDRYYSPASIRRYADSFEREGGRLDFHLYPFSGEDGHSLIFHADLWRPDFDRFFDKLGFPPKLAH